MVFLGDPGTYGFSGLIQNDRALPLVQAGGFVHNAEHDHTKSAFRSRNAFVTCA
jgi:hypothetical protein